MTTKKFDTTKNTSLFLDNQLCFSLYATSLVMTKKYRPLLEVLGLTYPQYVVMMALWQYQSLSAGALAQTVSLEAGTLAPLVRKLVSQGLLLRERCVDDDRSVIISLTAAGDALQEHAHEVHAKIGCMTRQTPQQLQELTGQLQRLRAALKQS